MATLYEHYNAGDDGATSVGYASIEWGCQTFTPATSHKITSVKLKIYREGSPGTITVGIRATSGGEPTGADLCSGTTDGDTLTEDSGGEWREITLGAGYDLVASTQYAIVVRVLGGDSSNYLGWRLDGSSPTYTGGSWGYSGDSGANWSMDTSIDMMFEEWGDPLWVLHELEVTDSLVLTDTLVKTPMKFVSDGVALSDVLIKNPIKTLVDSIAFTDALVGYKTMIKVFTDGVAFTDTLIRTFIRVFTDGIAFKDFLLKWRWLTPLRLLQPLRRLLPHREQEANE